MPGHAIDQGFRFHGMLPVVYGMAAVGGTGLVVAPALLASFGLISAYTMISVGGGAGHGADDLRLLHLLHGVRRRPLQRSGGHGVVPPGGAQEESRRPRHPRPLPPAAPLPHEEPQRASVHELRRSGVHPVYHLVRREAELGWLLLRGRRLFQDHRRQVPQPGSFPLVGSKALARRPRVGNPDEHVVRGIHVPLQRRQVLRGAGAAHREEICHHDRIRNGDLVRGVHHDDALRLPDVRRRGADPAAQQLPPHRRPPGEPRAPGDGLLDPVRLPFHVRGPQGVVLQRRLGDLGEVRGRRDEDGAAFPDRRRASRRLHRFPDDRRHERGLHQVGRGRGDHHRTHRSYLGIRRKLHHPRGSEHQPVETLGREPGPAVGDLSQQGHHRIRGYVHGHGDGGDLARGWISPLREGLVWDYCVRDLTHG